MPQGSDYYQRQKRLERADRCNMENMCREIDELRGRVRHLEELVSNMADKLDIPTESRWRYWG